AFGRSEESLLFSADIGTKLAKVDCQRLNPTKRTANAVSGRSHSAWMSNKRSLHGKHRNLRHLCIANLHQAMLDKLGDQIEQVAAKHVRIDSVFRQERIVGLLD